MMENVMVYQKFNELLQETMSRLQIPGVAAGVWHQGQEYTAVLGSTSLENPLPITEDTLFQIGSTTKTVTATAAMRLVEMGKLRLDEPIKTYLPDLQLQDAHVTSYVTLRHLFTHTGGWVGDYFEDTGLGEDALAKYVANMAHLPQLTPLGEVWSYNNAGFSLAGRVIEAVTGQSYETAVYQLVLQPLGMNHSLFFAHDAITYRTAMGHNNHEEQVSVARPWALARSAHAAGGISSSVKEQLRYARFHLGDGTAESGERLLTPETVKLMQTPQATADLGRTVGISWLIRRVGDTQIVAHGGATNGQMSAFELVPSHQFALVILTNADYGRILNQEVTEWALEHFLGLTTPKPALLEREEREIRPYLGHYDSQMLHIELYLQDGQLMAQFTPKGGFPDKDSPAPPAAPPVRLAFITPDRLLILDHPMKDRQAEFLRGNHGEIAWLRAGGRVFYKQ